MKRLYLSLLLVPLIGAGCFRIAPRIAKTPDAPSVAVQLAPAVVPSTMPALAYVELNGGAAMLTRNQTTLAAQEGMELLQGDALEVTQGHVHLIYPDAGMSEVDAGTKLAIIPDDGEGEAGVFTQIRLYSGKIWTRFEKVFGPAERFSVAANSVVATVRGTGFGVSIESDGVDVQVADHEVRVSEEEREDAATSTAQTPTIIALAAGQGLRITAHALAQIDAATVTTVVRRLSATERAARGYVFGASSLSPDRVKRPAHPVQLPIAPQVNGELEERIQILRRRAMLERVFPQFVAPLRAPQENELQVPLTAPSIQGPGSVLIQ